VARVSEETNTASDMERHASIASEPCAPGSMEST
jgi:hypothetical protein